MLLKKMISTAMVLGCFAISGKAQIEFSGTVNDENGTALPGAHVVLNNAYRGAYTNETGVFRFQKVKPGNYPIEVKFLGYKTYRDTVSLQSSLFNYNVNMQEDAILSDEVVISATRLKENSAATFTNVSQEDIEEINLGQDLPFLLNWTPSLVATSDAGAGVGYTGMRIRGNDGTRINVTINGIPVNDSESQGVFFVNMPDLGSSVESIQIQRGLGSSTNGAGAFGASVNVQTNQFEPESKFVIDNSFGSFNTRKHNLQFNTGLLDNNFAFDGRVSAIASDGYIDRAGSDLKSYYFSGGYFGKKTIVKAITFAGKEVTYQSWYGTPESRVNNDYDGMVEHAVNEGYDEEETENLFNSGRTYNYYRYKNQVDDYQQSHYQLHLSHQFNDNWNANLAGHYTRGLGFFEEYKKDEDIEDYGLNPAVVGADTAYSTDLIRRRWLDNHFYGMTYSLNYNKNKISSTLGGAYNQYRGDHYGEVIWAEFAGENFHEQQYYFGVGNKDDFNVFWKLQYSTQKFNFFTDLQLRKIDYILDGIDSDLSAYNHNKDYLFFNPKAGFRYNFNPKNAAYIYAGLGNKEPVRSDFVDFQAGPEPLPEQLYNTELGYEFMANSFYLKANAYLMYYKDQLVLTGALNDSGSSIRQNVDKSYRAGIEIETGVRISDMLSWNGNLTYSQNKIHEFTEVIYDGSEAIENVYEDADISFSPEWIAASRINFNPFKEFSVSFISKYVGDQYLDNTSNENRKLDAYFVNDVKLAWTFKPQFMKEIEIGLLVNNVFNEMYSSNGYTYSYFYERLVTENFYYPQAGINFLANLKLTF